MRGDVSEFGQWEEIMKESPDSWMSPGRIEHEALKNMLILKDGRERKSDLNCKITKQMPCS